MVRYKVEKVPKMFSTKNRAWCVSRGDVVVKWFKYKRNAIKYAKQKN